MKQDKAHFSISLFIGQPEAMDDLWSELYRQLNWKVTYLVHSYNVSSWRGQEEDVVEDIVQETLIRVYHYLRKVRDEDAAPIRSLQSFSMVIARHYCTDLQRKEARIVRSIDDAKEMRLYDPPSENVEDVAIERIYNEKIFSYLANIITSLPIKQQQVLLNDLAHRTDFSEQSLLQHLLNEQGVRLEEYQYEEAETFAERNRHAALLSLAYKRIRQLMKALLGNESEQQEKYECREEKRNIMKTQVNLFDKPQKDTKTFNSIRTSASLLKDYVPEEDLNEKEQIMKANQHFQPKKMRSDVLHENIHQQMQTSQKVVKWVELQRMAQAFLQYREHFFQNTNSKSLSEQEKREKLCFLNEHKDEEVSLSDQECRDQEQKRFEQLIVKQKDDNELEMLAFRLQEEAFTKVDAVFKEKLRSQLLALISQDESLVEEQELVDRNTDDKILSDTGESQREEKRDALVEPQGLLMTSVLIHPSKEQSYSVPRIDEADFRIEEDDGIDEEWYELVNCLQEQVPTRPEVNPVFKEILRERLLCIVNESEQLEEKEFPVAQSSESVFEPVQFIGLADKIADFPEKERIALCIDLAGHMSTNPQWVLICQAFADVGINLPSYQGIVSDEMLKDKEYASALNQAYRCTRDLCEQVQGEVTSPLQLLDWIAR